MKILRKIIELLNLTEEELLLYLEYFPERSF